MDENKPAYRTMDEYIQSFPKQVQTKLKQLKRLIKQTAPEAQEKISYGIPTFHLNGNLVHFAAFSRHIGFYPTSSGISNFKRELSKYKTSKGTIQFPLNEPLPIELLKKIVQFRVKENIKK